MNYLQRIGLYAGTALTILSSACSSPDPLIDGYRVHRQKEKTVFVETASINPNYNQIWPTFLIDQGNDGTIDLKCELIQTVRGPFCKGYITERERQAVRDISGRL